MDASPLPSRPASTPSPRGGAPTLVKMSVLAKRSGVPAATIKHYLREGLLPTPAARTGRNMAWYDAALVDRIRTIKELQRTRFLPLRVIRTLLDQGDAGGVAQTAAAIERTLTELAPPEQRTRAELLEAGMPEDQLDWLCAAGLLTPLGPESAFRGDDLALLQTLGAARRVGLSPEMLPFTILVPYLDALRALVRAELGMFRHGVLPRAPAEVEPLAEAATVLSERLVVLLRRKLLLPMLRQLVEEGARPALSRARAEGAPRATAGRAKPAPRPGATKAKKSRSTAKPDPGSTRRPGRAETRRRRDG